MNDSYSKFRFGSRAAEVLSPLSCTKLGFLSMSQKMRKMSLTQHNQTIGDGASNSAMTSMR